MRIGHGANADTVQYNNYDSLYSLIPYLFLLGHVFGYVDCTCTFSLLIRTLNRFHGIHKDYVFNTHCEVTGQYGQKKVIVFVTFKSMKIFWYGTKYGRQPDQFPIVNKGGVHKRRITHVQYRTRYDIFQSCRQRKGGVLNFRKRNAYGKNGGKIFIIIIEHKDGCISLCKYLKMFGNRPYN